MVEIYSSCTNCYKELSDSDKELNISEDNNTYPVCEECLYKAFKLIEDEKKK